MFSKNDVLVLNIDRLGDYMEKSMYSLSNEYLHKKYFYTNSQILMIF